MCYKDFLLFGNRGLAFLAIAGAVSTCLPGNASAAISLPSIGLYNTGTDSADKVLAPVAFDTHYTLTTTAAPPNSGVSTTNPAYGHWLANDAPGSSGSSWITPTQFANSGSGIWPSTAPAGLYTYSLTFTAPGSYLVVDGHWATDNSGQLFLNGNLVLPSSLGFGTWTNFELNSSVGLVAGANTLEFRVTNASGGSGNPTGLRAEFLSASVPEPGSLVVWSLLGLVLGGAGCWRRRKRAA